MRQRNVSGYPLLVPERGVQLEPGEEIDHDVPVTGCAPVDGQKQINARGGDADEDGAAQSATHTISGSSPETGNGDVGETAGETSRAPRPARTKSKGGTR